MIDKNSIIYIAGHNGMVASDLTLFKKDILLMEAGHTVYVQQE